MPPSAKRSASGGENLACRRKRSPKRAISTGPTSAASSAALGTRALRTSSRSRTRFDYALQICSLASNTTSRRTAHVAKAVAHATARCSYVKRSSEIARKWQLVIGSVALHRMRRASVNGVPVVLRLLDRRLFALSSARFICSSSIELWISLTAHLLSSRSARQRSRATTRVEAG